MLKEYFPRTRVGPEVVWCFPLLVYILDMLQPA
jgi:hypothetical protein